jgi:uncharacterized protein
MAMTTVTDRRPTFNVAQLLKEPVGATRTGYVDADLHDLVPQADLDEAADQPQVSLAGLVRLMHVIDGVLAQGNLSAELTLPCVRCLDPVKVPLEIPLEETFAPTIDIVTGQTVRPEEEDRALWIDEHHILDLSEVLRQDILVALPVHVVCSPDCRGLCPTCGKNLNEGDCDCTSEPDPRWAVLQDLLKDRDNKEK